jgi:FMN reductase
MLKVSVLIGNPKPQSRTARIATTLAEKLLTPDTYTLSVTDLADHAKHIFDWPSEQLATLNQHVAESDLLIVASPTYKATYTGLLKAFLDRYPNLGLQGVVAIPVMTGADLRHSMAPEVNLRPLLVELGAIVPTPGLYFVMDQMTKLDTVLTDWAAQARTQLNAHLPATLTAVTAEH